MEARWEGLSGRHTARLYDVSLSGCYIETMGRAEPGERVRFEVELPGRGWVRFEGEVVHADPDMGFGVRLSGVTDEDRRDLELLLDYARAGR